MPYGEDASATGAASVAVPCVDPNPAPCPGGTVEFYRMFFVSGPGQAERGDDGCSPSPSPSPSANVSPVVIPGGTIQLTSAGKATVRTGAGALLVAGMAMVLALPQLP